MLCSCQGKHWVLTKLPKIHPIPHNHIPSYPLAGIKHKSFLQQLLANQQQPSPFFLFFVVFFFVVVVVFSPAAKLGKKVEIQGGGLAGSKAMCIWAGCAWCFLFRNPNTGKRGRGKVKKDAPLGTN